MASQEAWDFAHAYFGRLWKRMGLAMLPCLGKGENMVGLWGGILSAVECVPMLLAIVPTERALKKRF